MLIYQIFVFYQKFAPDVKQLTLLLHAKIAVINERCIMANILKFVKIVMILFTSKNLLIVFIFLVLNILNVYGSSCALSELIN